MDDVDDIIDGARAGFLGQGAGADYPFKLSLVPNGCCSSGKGGGGRRQCNAFVLCHVLLMERGPIFVLQRSGAYANDTPRGGPVPAALGTAGLVGTSIKVAATEASRRPLNYLGLCRGPQHT